MSVMDELHDKANEIYAYRKLGSDAAYRAPEDRPKIKSDQVMAIFEVLCEEIENLKRQIVEISNEQT